MNPDHLQLCYNKIIIWILFKQSILRLRHLSTVHRVIQSLGKAFCPSKSSKQCIRECLNTESSVDVQRCAFETLLMYQHKHRSPLGPKPQSNPAPLPPHTCTKTRPETKFTPSMEKASALFQICDTEYHWHCARCVIWFYL